MEYIDLEVIITKMTKLKFELLFVIPTMTLFRSPNVFDIKQISSQFLSLGNIK